MALSIFTGTILDQSSVQYTPWRVFATLTTSFARADIGPYRPENWRAEAQTCVTDKDGTEYVFDAILKLDHTSGRKITENPIQTGANISDHSYQLPSTLTIDIGMSDCMDSYKFFQWGMNDGDSAPTKSVMAYEKIIEWQQSGDPLEIRTRLMSYTNMVVETVSAPDDYQSKHGLRCMVTFKQIITAEVSEVDPDSSIRNANIVKDLGTKNGILMTGTTFTTIPSLRI